MKFKYFLSIILILMILLVGCNKPTTNETKEVKSKEGYIVDIIENKENYSILCYESSENKLSTITCTDSEKRDNINGIIHGLRRSKGKVIVDVSEDGYLINDIKEYKSNEKDIKNEALDFNLIKGERLSREKKEGDFILKICYPHYYFNVANYDKGEYIPDKKVDSALFLEYFMWLNDWEDHKYLAPNKMGKHFAEEYDAQKFLDKAKGFFPHISDNALNELPVYNANNEDFTHYLFYETQKNVLLTGDCGIGGAGILYPILRDIDYIDENTLRFILMDKSFEKPGSVNEWEYIVKLKENGQWKFEKINYIE